MIQAVIILAVKRGLLHGRRIQVFAYLACEEAENN
jgi:hypothetical protein